MPHMGDYGGKHPTKEMKKKAMKKHEKDMKKPQHGMQFSGR